MSATLLDADEIDRLRWFLFVVDTHTLAGTDDWFSFCSHDVQTIEAAISMGLIEFDRSEPFANSKIAVTAIGKAWRAANPFTRPTASAAPVASTPSARWRENGEQDPHGDRYRRERTALSMGDLTDDELANAVYLFDHRKGLESLSYLTAAKDRIRWLSRALETALTEGGDVTTRAELASARALAETYREARERHREERDAEHAARLTAEASLKEAQEENERWRRFLVPVDEFYADAFSILLEADVYEDDDTLKEGPAGDDYAEVADNVLTGIRFLAAAKKAAETERDAATKRVDELFVAASYVYPYLRYTIGDESPGHHPTMPSAVSAFGHAFGLPESLERFRERMGIVKSSPEAPSEPTVRKGVTRLIDTGTAAATVERLRRFLSVIEARGEAGVVGNDFPKEWLSAYGRDIGFEETSILAGRLGLVLLDRDPSSGKIRLRLTEIGRHWLEVAAANAFVGADGETTATTLENDVERYRVVGDLEAERSALTLAHVSDAALANSLFLVDPKEPAGNASYLTAARDRILWLSKTLEAWTAPPETGGAPLEDRPTASPETDDELALARKRIDDLERGARYVFPYLTWTIGDESPGHHPTMPSAVAAFAHTFGLPESKDAMRERLSTRTHLERQNAQRADDTNEKDPT